MRITPRSSPVTPPASATDGVAQPAIETSNSPEIAANDVQDAVGKGQNALEMNLDAQMQKAHVASLFATPFQAVPNQVRAQVQALKSPDAALRPPKPETVSQLHDMLKAALGKAASGKEEDRAAVDKILQMIVDAYGIGQNGVTGLEFDPKSEDQGDTIGKNPKTFITVGKGGLNSPAEAASTLLHESNHVRRNKELADLGIDRDKFGVKAEGIYSAMSEIEGYQLEINNAKKLGTSADYVTGAENLHNRYLHDLELAGAGQEIIELVKKGQFDEAFKKFRQGLSTK